MENLIKKTQRILDLTEQISAPIYAKLTQFGSIPKPERKFIVDIKQIQSELTELLYELGYDSNGFYDAEINMIYRKYVISKYIGKPVPSLAALAKHIGKSPSVVSRMINKTTKQLLEEGVIIEEDRRIINTSVIDPDAFCRNYLASIRYNARNRNTTQAQVQSLGKKDSGGDGIQ